MLLMVDPIINFLLDALPMKKFTCDVCHFVFHLPRGSVRDCQKNMMVLIVLNVVTNMEGKRKEVIKLYFQIK